VATRALVARIALRPSSIAIDTKMKLSVRKPRAPARKTYVDSSNNEQAFVVSQT
jgi:hypothetical protein